MSIWSAHKIVSARVGGYLSSTESSLSVVGEKSLAGDEARTNPTQCPCGPTNVMFNPLIFFLDLSRPRRVTSCILACTAQRWFNLELDINANIP